MKRSIAALMLLFAGCSCPGNLPSDNHVKITGVERVLMHREDYYRLFVQDPNTKVLKEITFFCPVKFVADVPAGRPMWATYSTHEAHEECHPRMCFDRNGPTFHIYDVEIHLRSAQDIGGGGYTYGKHGSGTTEVIR